MSSKTFIWIGLFLGSSLGSLMPLLWHAGPFSFSGIFFSATGGLSGIWLGYIMSNRL